MSLQYIIPSNSLEKLINRTTDQPVARLPSQPSPYCSPSMMGVFNKSCNSGRIDRKSGKSKGTRPLSPDRGTTRPTKNDMSEPPYTSPLRAGKPAGSDCTQNPHMTSPHCAPRRPLYLRKRGICGSTRVELSQVEFLDLSQANYFEHICEELFSSIKNESYGIRHCRSRCGSNFSGLVTCFVGLCHLHFLAVACAGFAGDDAPYAVCPSIDDNPEMPGTMDQKDSNEGAESAGSCGSPEKAQASARLDVPTAPMTLKYIIEHADDGRPATMLSM